MVPRPPPLPAVDAQTTTILLSVGVIILVLGCTCTCFSCGCCKCCNNIGDDSKYGMCNRFCPWMPCSDPPFKEPEMDKALLNPMSEKDANRSLFGECCLVDDVSGMSTGPDAGPDRLSPRPYRYQIDPNCFLASSLSQVKASGLPPRMMPRSLERSLEARQRQEERRKKRRMIVSSLLEIPSQMCGSRRAVAVAERRNLGLEGGGSRGRSPCLPRRCLRRMQA